MAKTTKILIKKLDILPLQKQKNCQFHSNKTRIDTVRQTSRKHNYKDKPAGFIEGSIFGSFRGRKREQ